MCPPALNGCVIVNVLVSVRSKLMMCDLSPMCTTVAITNTLHIKDTLSVDIPETVTIFVTALTP